MIECLEFLIVCLFAPGYYGSVYLCSWIIQCILCFSSEWISFGNSKQGGRHGHLSGFMRSIFPLNPNVVMGSSHHFSHILTELWHFSAFLVSRYTYQILLLIMPQEKVKLSEVYSMYWVKSSLQLKKKRKEKKRTSKNKT